MSFDVYRVRRDFPAFGQELLGRPFIYLDSAATSQKPRQVLRAMNEYYEKYCANVHRSTYRSAEQATEAYETARRQVAHFVNAPSPRGIVFTKNCTEAINLVAYSWARKYLRPGDEILCSVMEHHSNLVPWQLAARSCGAHLRFIPILSWGQLDLSHLDEMVSPKTRLVAVTGMSNVFGSCLEFSSLIRAAHTVGACVLIDATQLVAHSTVDFQQMETDFTVFSGHKLFGPTGVGVLVAKPEILDEMDPFLSGGEMIREVTLEDATWNDLPYKFEAGTPPIAEAIGLGAALDYLERLEASSIQEQEAQLTYHGLRLLKSLPGVILYGEPEAQGRVPLFSFNIEDGYGGIIHPHDVETVLAEQGFNIRAGHHCAKPLMRILGVPATCRVSCAFYNTVEELEALASVIEQVQSFFAQKSRR